MFTASKIVNFSFAALIGAGGYVLRGLVDKKRDQNASRPPDLDKQLIENLTKANEDLTVKVDDLKTTLLKLMDEARVFLRRSQEAGAMQKLAITSSILITASVFVVIAFIPSIQWRLHRWISKMKTDVRKESKDTNGSEGQVTTEEKQQEPKRVIFQVAADAEPLREDLADLRNILFESQDLQNLSPVSIEVINDQCDFVLDPSMLVFRFEMVDDRIRELKQKELISQELFSLTNENCVWVFNCFKPTDAVDGTSINNSVNSLENFKSGYVKKNGTKVSTWLRFHYSVHSRPDRDGNFQHRLTQMEKMRDKILNVIKHHF